MCLRTVRQHNANINCSKVHSLLQRASLITFTVALHCLTGFFFGGVIAVPAYNTCGLLALWPSIFLLFGGGAAYVLFIARHTNISFLRAIMRPVLDPATYTKGPARMLYRQRGGRKSSRRPSAYAYSSQHGSHHQQRRRSTRAAAAAAAAASSSRHVPRAQTEPVYTEPVAASSSSFNEPQML
jgi:hypothetical protein